MMGEPSNHAHSDSGLTDRLAAIAADPEDLISELAAFLSEENPILALQAWLGSSRFAAGLKDKEAEEQIFIPNKKVSDAYKAAYPESADKVVNAAKGLGSVSAKTQPR